MTIIKNLSIYNNQNSLIYRFKVVKYNYQQSQSMDSRIYFHQHRRPRYNNPTYVSSNVNTSLTFFQSKEPASHNYYDNYNSYMHQNTQNIKQQRIEKQMYTENPNSSAYRERGNSQGRGNSNLSSYGSNSLSLNQKDIFNKQNQKFDIITMKPKQYNTSIGQYPRYTLQNKDQLYYKRMSDLVQNKKDSSYQQKLLKNQFIAGKHTYGHERNRIGDTNPESYEATNRTMFNPKMLNHMDQLHSLS